jgi:hypothetical protein
MNKDVTGGNLTGTVSDLVEVGRIDTVCRDLYLQRASELLRPQLGLDDYRVLQRMQVELASLPNEIRNAMGRGEWRQVKDLSAQLKSVKHDIESRRTLQELGKAVYEDEEVPLDPFSPGMQSLAGVTIRALPDIRQKGVRYLEGLAARDEGWREFYNARLAALKGVAISSDAEEETRPTSGNLMQEALEALDSGKFEKLHELAGTLEQGVPTEGEGPARAGELEGARAEDLDCTFPEESVQRGRALGLVPERAESRYQEIAHLLRFAWHPTFSHFETDQSGAMRVSLPLAEDTPAARKDRIELFALHPFVNSGGVRSMPKLVAEDLLVEDFDDPPSGADAPRSALLDALGLPRRNGVSRIQLQRALNLKGNDVVRDALGLDPFRFRLILIPPDIHARLGLRRGWGNQKLWTHFDGYMVMPGGKLQALAGGDVRFGGVYDMVGVGRNYDSDQIIARFAVVQRRRMAL